ncbi:MAG TPA: hypothetical protein PLK94_04750 [Alphaproteobacteria bacterium]|nr:hypothetical protein [Alphaproteobacteria bacterium]HOO50582.1 hypothetical protein [Alphaproteobacteria bacterium]
MLTLSANLCPVCGKDISPDEFWDQGGCASFIICECCGVESGYQYNPSQPWEGQIDHIKELRKEWFAKLRDFESKAGVENLDFDRQLKNLPDEIL